MTRLATPRLGSSRLTSYLVRVLSKETLSLLASRTRQTHLNLSANQLRQGATVPLAQALEINHTLSSLDLSLNLIGGEDVREPHSLLPPSPAQPVSPPCHTPLSRLS